MTDVTKKEVKKDTFAGFRENALSMLNAAGLPFKVEDTWESVSEAADYAARMADKKGERGNVQMAVGMWVHGYLECKTMEQVCRVAGYIDADGKEPAAEAGDSSTK